MIIEPVTIKAESTRNVHCYWFAGNCRSFRERIYLMYQFGMAAFKIVLLGKFAIERPKWWQDIYQ